MAQRVKSSWESLLPWVGTAIVVIMFGLFCASAVTKRVRVNNTLALPFLTGAFAMIGGPAGYRFVLSRNGSGKPPPPSE